MKYRLINEINENLSPTQQILVNRGIEAKDIEHYLKTKDSCIIDPKKLDNMEYGAERFISAMNNDEDVMVIVDCDADGYTSAAGLINYIGKVKPSYLSKVQIRMHDGKEHGIESKWLEDIIGKCSLVICPDSSSNDYEQHRILKENGIDVLVLDHHEADRVSENAIIINNQLSSDYENKSLSGVGIVYKFCSYLDKKLDMMHSNEMLDLVALGEIADMMDMRSFETKHLIQKGLANIVNPFFKELVNRQSYSLGGVITPIGVAFYIAPLINATIRVGTKEEKEIMFKAMLNNLAYEQVPSTKRGCKGSFESIVEQAVRNSTNIRNRQKRARDSGLEAVETIIERDKLLDNKILLIESPSCLDKNLTGLVANQLMAKYQKPVLLLRKVISEDGVVLLQGSGRGYDKSELSDLRDFLLYSGMFNFAEGHPSAFGCSINADKAKSFINFSNKQLENMDFTALYNIDFAYEANDFKSQDILEIGSMKSLWGKGVDEALILIKGIKITKQNISLLSPDRNPTIKISLPNGTSLIKFGASREEYTSLLSDGFIEINAIGTAAINEWNGNITPQILVKDYEIISSQKYYF